MDVITRKHIDADMQRVLAAAEDHAVDGLTSA